MNDTVECDEEYFGPKRDSIYVVIPVTVIYVIIFITGTVGNVSTCIVIARNKAMHTATNYYLFSLAMSDLLLLITGLPQEIYLFWSRYPYIFGSTFCFLRGLFAETSTNATVLTIAAFTIERYLAICHPFLSHTMSRLSRAIKLILGIWLLSILLAVPQAIPLQVIGDCPQCMIVDTVIDHAFELSTFLFFVAPMLLIIVLYILIGIRLKSSRSMKKRINSNARIQSKSSRKVIKMLVSVVVAFFICWAPFHAQRLYSIYQRPTPETHYLHLKIYEIVTYISGILYYVSTTINPILYNIMSVKFREAFKETFARCCGIGQQHHGKPQGSYSVLSRSNIRGPDSIDSAGSHDHTTQVNTSSVKTNSVDSYTGQRSSKRSKFSSSVNEVLEENQNRTESRPRLKLKLKETHYIPDQKPKYLSVHLGSPTPPTKLNKFLQLFHCLAKKTIDDGKKITSYYSIPIRENVFELEKTEDRTDKETFKRCENFKRTGLKNMECGVVEDELTTYMNEVQRRECFS